MAQEYDGVPNTQHTRTNGGSRARRTVWQPPLDALQQAPQEPFGILWDPSVDRWWVRGWSPGGGGGGGGVLRPSAWPPKTNGHGQDGVVMVA